MIDFSKRDGRTRLEEIRRAVDEGTFINWTELIFLPLYGKETGSERSELAEKVLRFETGLYHAQKIPVKLLAATLVMSNKLIDRKRLTELREEVKMLDILEIAREKGIEEGKIMGLLENAREMLTDALIEKFSVIPQHISERIRDIQNRDVLKGLFRQVFRCGNLQAFEELLNRV